jgi:predicted NBD/HSP70 family sugar kinase
MATGAMLRMMNTAMGEATRAAHLPRVLSSQLEMVFPNGTRVVGVDVGGSNVRGVLVDAAASAVSELAEPTSDRDAATVVSQVGGLARRLAVQAGIEWREVAAVGVGVPGVVHRGTGELEMAPNLPPFGDVDLAEALGLELATDVVVDNDVNMATVGERSVGLGEGVGNFAFLAIGTGIGMGIVSDGRLLHGTRGAAGEIGDLRLSDGRTLEEVAGGAGVAARWARRTGTDGVTAEDVYAAAEAGDRPAREVIDEQVVSVALAVAAAQAVLDPELVIIGGGIGSRAGFVGLVREEVRRLGAAVRVERSALGERAGLVGAAEAARTHALLRPERVDA